jgi:antitoxin VapB
MALSLKNTELEKLARRRAKRRGETLTEAILSALQESERNAARAAKKISAEEILRLAERVRALPVLSTRSEEEILGYDEHGIPTQ